MRRFQLITPILGDGDVENPFRPQVIDDYTLSMEDVTGRESPPSVPLTTTVECVSEDSVFTQIEGDNTYYILWDEPNPKPPNESPDANEFGQLRSYLAQQQFSQQWINDTIGTSVDGRTRSEIADDLREGLRQL